MWLLYLAGFVFIGSMAAVAVAVVVMMKNSSKINAIEPVTIRAEVVGEHGQLPDGVTLYDPHHLGASKMSILFHTDKDQYIKLNVKHKDFYRLIQGMYGELEYHGNNMISFTHLPDHEEARRQQLIADHPDLEGDVSSDVYFYVSMPSLNIVIPTDQAIKANKDQIFTIIEQIYDNSTENFVGLDNEKQVIQFANDGYSTDIVMDIPDTKKEGSYQAILYDIETVKDVIEAFFGGDDIIAKYRVEFIKW